MKEKIFEIKEVAERDITIIAEDLRCADNYMFELMKDLIINYRCCKDDLDIKYKIDSIRVKGDMYIYTVKEIAICNCTIYLNENEAIESSIFNIDDNMNRFDFEKSITCISDTSIDIESIIVDINEGETETNFGPWNIHLTKDVSDKIDHVEITKDYSINNMYANMQKLEKHNITRISELLKTI